MAIIIICSITCTNLYWYENTRKKMRPRIIKGTLVASTDIRKSIVSKRLIIKVVYSALNYKVLSQQVGGIRTSFEQ